MSDVGISIIVAVDNHGYGTVLSWAGDNNRLPGGGLSQWECFGEEVSMSGRCCEDLCLNAPPEPAGVYRFDGSMGYRGHEEDAEPVYTGSWTLLYELPAL